MKPRSIKIILYLSTFLLLAYVNRSAAEDLTITWDVNAESDLAGYNLYVGLAEQVYSDVVNVGLVTRYTWNNLEAGKTYYFAVTAYDFSGNESDFSASVFMSLPFAGNLPTLMDVLVLGRTQVDAIFSGPLEITSAQDFRNYSISQDVGVIGAILGQDRTTVHLVSSIHQPNENYILNVANVKDTSGNKVRAGNARSYKMPSLASDVVSPVIHGAILQDRTTVKINFSENVSESQAEELSNYLIEPDLAILRAKLTRDHSVVKLTTAPHSDEQEYRLTLQNIQDLASNALGANNSVTYISDFSSEDLTRPALVSVSVRGATQIDVHFSEPLDRSSAEFVSNYSIGPDVAIIGAILSTGLTTVHLITARHFQDQEYTLTVVDVRDRSANENKLTSSNLTYVLGSGPDFGTNSGANNGPETITLLPNYPNPFNPETEIRFFLDERRRIELKIYNPLGQSVRTLVKGDLVGGYHSIVWDGRNDDDIHVPSGVYMYSLEVAGRVEFGASPSGPKRRVQRMTLLR